MNVVHDRIEQEIRVGDTVLVPAIGDHGCKLVTGKIMVFTARGVVIDLFMTDSFVGPVTVRHFPKHIVRLKCGA